MICEGVALSSDSISVMNDHRQEDIYKMTTLTLECTLWTLSYQHRSHL